MEWLSRLVPGVLSFGMLPYEKLTAWQHAHELVLAVYRLTAGLPASELYGLARQARRAAFSVAANIAEGAAKRGDAELCRFLDIALGSLSELSYCLRLAFDLGYISEADWSTLEKKRDEVGRKVWGLYRSARNRLANRRRLPT